MMTMLGCFSCAWAFRGAKALKPTAKDIIKKHEGLRLKAYPDPGSGGVPWVWKDLMVCSPQAWPLFRSASVQVMVRQSGASTSRAPFSSGPQI